MKTPQSPPWLQAPGYRTALFGSISTDIPQIAAACSSGMVGLARHVRQREYFNYRVNENGTVRTYGDRSEDYELDIHAANIVRFIEEAETRDSQPWFIYCAPHAPHGDPRLGLGQEGAGSTGSPASHSLCQRDGAAHAVLQPNRRKRQAGTS